MFDTFDSEESARAFVDEHHYTCLVTDEVGLYLALSVDIMQFTT